MLPLKKLFTEGLVQMAVLLSLSGLGVDVGLESYLPPSWQDSVFASTSTLMKPHDQLGGPKEFHSLHPKSEALQELLQSPRLLNQVHSLDRLQLPDAVLQTWLVQQEPLQRPAQGQREWSGLPVEPRAADREEEDDEELLQDGRVESGGLRRSELPPTAEDLELLWQDVSFLLEEEGADLGRTSLNSTVNSTQHGSSHGGSQVRPEPVLLPLTPSAQLDDHGSEATADFRLDSLPLRLNSSDLFTEDFLEGLNDISTSLNFSLLPEHHLREEEPEASGAGPTPPSFTPASDGRMSRELLAPSSRSVLPDQEEDDDLPSLLTELLGDATILDDMNLLDLDLEDGFCSKPAAKLEEGFSREVTEMDVHVGDDDDQTGIPEDAEEMDSDSGLSLDCSHSPASSGAFSGSSSSSSTLMSCTSSERTLFSEDEEGSLDSEAEEEEGAVGGSAGISELLPIISEDHKRFHGFSSRLEHVGHDHTYNQTHLRKTFSAPRSDNARRHGRSSSPLWSHGERRAHSLKVPFSTELIVNLPVDQFNEMLSDYQLSEEQLTLVKDIRRRGKNKIAAQNCRKRKHDVLLGLEEDILALRGRRSALLRENREALWNLQQMKHRLGLLYQEVLSELGEEQGEFTLLFGPEGTPTEEKTSQKRKRKKK
ncbi:endoplasmic reticulum membrane sensor NFE2L1a isoform X2 [Oryzias melastigma]|uniref:endoplasmic reticulum membrane sensor NFE2L1a isoform X2 n=1 Tax=Oryzias melastigma TaxID=30732 RepID=UPI000CF82B62|nr:endoplasmic reticulum membrane sensor NFE2L1a isoform X2 [Oryzias melastigma]